MQHNLYAQAIEEFSLKGKDISNISDLLLRGTGKTSKEMTPGWSDLDFSIVLKKFTQANRREVRLLARTFVSLR